MTRASAPESGSSRSRSQHSRRQEELAHVATLHYVEGLEQQEIAELIHVSPSTVSRMLREALACGIVEIRVNHPLPRDGQLEQELQERFGLPEAWVLGKDPEGDLDALGRLGARCLESRFSTELSLSICWGNTTRAVIESLRPIARSNVHTVQMIGSMGSSDALIDGGALTRLAAARLGGGYTLLNAPLVVDDADFATRLLSQGAIKRVLSRAANTDYALAGLGSIDPEHSALCRAGFVSKAELLEARDLGAVGDICGNLVDGRGRPVRSTLSERIISLPLEQLSSIRRVIGVAIGREKAGIIRAALLGRHLHALVTDRSTATMLLEPRAPSTRAESRTTGF